MTITVDIPALDRLCDILEGSQKAAICEQLKTEIVHKLKEAVESGVPKPVFKEVQPDDDHPWKDEAMPDQEPAPKPAAAPVPVTLAAVQKACAALLDQGKMDDIKALFPEFGIKKLSDLKDPGRLEAFAQRLRGLGAAI